MLPYPITPFAESRHKSCHKVLEPRTEFGSSKDLWHNITEPVISFDYDIEDLNRRFGEGNWRFAYWKEERKVEVIRRSTYLKVTYTPIVSVGLEHQLVRIPTENACSCRGGFFDVSLMCPPYELPEIVSIISLIRAESCLICSSSTASSLVACNI